MRKRIFMKRLSKDRHYFHAYKLLDKYWPEVLNKFRNYIREGGTI